MSSKKRLKIAPTILTTVSLQSWRLKLTDTIKNMARKNIFHQVLNLIFQYFLLNMAITGDFILNIIIIFTSLSLRNLGGEKLDFHYLPRFKLI